MGFAGNAVSGNLEKKRRRLQANLAAIACLIAIAAHFLIPWAHHHSIFAEPSSHQCSLHAGGGSTHPGTDKSHDAIRGIGAHHSRHDPSTCAICQELLHSSIYMRSLSPGDLYAFLICEGNASFFFSIHCNRTSLSKIIPRAPPAHRFV